MTGKIKSSNQKGFTIIEVMIVLAIAGIIMMLVFLAIPALQRSNRNTQIRSDVASVLGFINEHSVNNNGRLPQSVCIDQATGEVYAYNTTGCVTTDDDFKIGTIRGGIDLDDDGAMPAEGVTGTISLALGFRCNEAGDGIGDDTNRATAALYRVETAGGTQTQCQE